MAEETKMSSEENQELAKDALNAAGEETSPASESEQNVPLAKHVALRKRAQEAELGQARLQGRVEAMTQMQTQQAPAVKSPLQLEIERQTAEGIAEEDMVISPKIIQTDKIHDKQVANQKAETDKQNALKNQQGVSADKSRVKYTDWQDVVTLGQRHLTAGELLDIQNAGADYGELAYSKCEAALERVKPEPEKKAAALEKELEQSKEKDKVPTQQEILDDIVADPVAIAASQL